MGILLIFLSCTLWYVSAKPNECCPNNDVLLDHNNCSTQDLHFHCLHGFYTLLDSEFKINHIDETLQLLDSNGVNIQPEEYCLARLETNQKVALVCFSTAVDENLDIPRMICWILSIICLALTLIVYIMLPNLRDLQGKCMMFTIFSLFMAFFFLAVLQYMISDVSDLVCEALASILYFWFMNVFSWLNVVSFNVWRSIVRPRLLSNKNHLFFLYNLYSWGMSVIFLLIVLTCHKVPGNHIKPKFGETSCWFSDSAGLRSFFYGPISVLIILNIIMFISIAWTLSKQKNHKADRKRRSHLFKFGLYLKLFITMGICWIFEPLSELFSEHGYYLWIVTDYINSLQGVIIFLLIVVFRRRVRRDLARRSGFCCRTLSQEWATIPDEDIDELEEHIDELESSNDNNIALNETL